MIYVIQAGSITKEYAPVYAGPSAREALLAASKLTSCRVTVWSKGKRYGVTHAIPSTEAGHAEAD